VIITSSPGKTGRGRIAGPRCTPLANRNPAQSRSRRRPPRPVSGHPVRFPAILGRGRSSAGVVARRPRHRGADPIVIVPLADSARRHGGVELSTRGRAPVRALDDDPACTRLMLGREPAIMPARFIVVTAPATLAACAPQACSK